MENSTKTPKTPEKTPLEKKPRKKRESKKPKPPTLEIKQGPIVVKFD